MKIRATQNWKGFRKPEVPAACMQPLSALLEAQQQADITPGMYSAFHEFDATLTNALRTR